MNIKCFVIEPIEDELEPGQKRNYRRSDTGEIFEKYKWPVGAMWRATWLEDMPNFCGTDGQCWCVMTPGGEWMIDGRASNCTLPEDNMHQCWVRHGIAPDFTVDKNGTTCSAGAGSILCGQYHGFLRNGELTDC